LAPDDNASPHPRSDPAWRPPLDPALPVPPVGAVDHPNLKEHLYANLGADRVVLDVGCGNGPFEYAKYACRFVAFDMFDPGNLEGLKPGDTFRKARLETFPLDDASCDAVVLGFILEHVERPAVFLREAHRVLRPGGWCYVAVPHHRSLEDRMFRLATRVAGSTRGPHIQRFTFDNLKTLVERDAGFELQAWHLLGGSFLWMTHPRLAWARPPFITALNGLKALGLDLYRESNYQLLLRRP
jgi:SAM-dependent methyltransferase